MQGRAAVRTSRLWPVHVTVQLCDWILKLSVFLVGFVPSKEVCLELIERLSVPGVPTDMPIITSEK